jgi:hypothetical protein
MLNLLQLQTESGSNFLKIHLYLALFLILLENISMMSEKDKISLIVEGHNPSSFEFWLLWEQSGKESANSSTQFCVEIIQNQFRIVIGGVTMVMDILIQLDA